jgi:hypothetical protein
MSRECSSQEPEDIKEWLDPSGLSSQKLYELICMCHPYYKGEPYHRGDVIDAIRKRDNILKDIGWPDTEDTLFRNRHTAGEQTLAEIINEDIHHPQFPDKKLWSLMENWKPVFLWTKYDEDNLMDSFKKKRASSLTAFGFG